MGNSPDYDKHGKSEECDSNGNGGTWANEVFSIEEVDETCQLYKLTNNECAQTGIDCKYKKEAEKFEAGLKEGTCASQGYTVKKSTTTKTYPVIGKITITLYAKSENNEIPNEL
jgi:hypothetical protein